MKVDVVYPLATRGSRWGNNELRYSLRALVKNFRDLGTVWVIGPKPIWLTGVRNLPVPDRHSHNKDANLITKLVAACKAGVSPTFIRSSDDELLLSPCVAEDLVPLQAGNILDRKPEYFEKGWRLRLKNTADYLIEKGLPALHYDVHVPVVYDRDLVMRVASEAPWNKMPGLTIDTLLCNHAGLQNPTEFTGQKATFESPVTKIEDVRERCAGRRYLGYSDAGLTDALKEFLQETFPDPTPFEQIVYRYKKPAAPALPSVVVVAGAPRSGSSCTAGIVDALGVSMGSKRMRPANSQNERGFFEDMVFRAALRGHYKVHVLRNWAKNRLRERTIGGKYWMACLHVPELVAAFPDLRVITIDRDMDAVSASMENVKSLPGMKDAKSRRQYIENAIQTRDRELRRLEVKTLAVQYQDILDNPEREVRRIAEFLGTAPSEERIQAAIRFVEPTLKHF